MKAARTLQKGLEEGRGELGDSCLGLELSSLGGLRVAGLK